MSFTEEEKQAIQDTAEEFRKGTQILQTFRLSGLPCIRTNKYLVLITIGEDRNLTAEEEQALLTKVEEEEFKLLTPRHAKVLSHPERPDIHPQKRRVRIVGIHRK